MPSSAFIAETNPATIGASYANARYPEQNVKISGGHQKQDMGSEGEDRPTEARAEEIIGSVWSIHLGATRAGTSE
jgi:hypothetical protein